MSPSAEWHSRLGPLDFSVGVRHFQLGGALPDQLPALPDAEPGELRRTDPAPGGPVRAADDDVLDAEPEGGTAP